MRGEEFPAERWISGFAKGYHGNIREPYSEVIVGEVLYT